MRLLWFAREMKKKLEANSRKAGWHSCTLGYLSRRLAQERQELVRAIKEKNKKKIIEECADVANFAMMIADNVNASLEEE